MPMLDEEILKNDPTLNEVIHRLVEAFAPQRIYLFGSCARGGAGLVSDYDLMLVVRDDARPERRRSRLAYQALRGTGVAVDVLVWPEDRFTSRLGVIASLPATIVREGKLLYAA